MHSPGLLKLHNLFELLHGALFHNHLIQTSLWDNTTIKILQAGIANVY